MISGFDTLYNGTTYVISGSNILISVTSFPTVQTNEAGIQIGDSLLDTGWVSPSTLKPMCAIQSVGSSRFDPTLRVPTTIVLPLGPLLVTSLTTSEFSLLITYPP
jgi:hypothetical protein